MIQTYYCAFGRSRSHNRIKIKSCPWTKFCIFENIGGKPPRDINEAVFTVYAGPGNDHDPMNHAKWNAGMNILFFLLKYFSTNTVDIHPYKIAPPLFVKKSISAFTKETKDLTLTQAVHTMEKEIIKSDMTIGLKLY